MADKWSVALFGHNKPRYELREKEKTIVKLPLHDKRNQFVQRWQNKCVGRFVDLPIDFDPNKYFIYNVIGWERRAVPGDIIACKRLKDKNKWTPLERKHFLIVTIEGPTLRQMTGGVIEPYWDINSYEEPNPEHPEIGLYPMDTVKKRRMCIGLEDLKDRGVDLKLMLSKDTLYSPHISTIPISEGWDKMKNGRMKDTDGFQNIKPRKTDGML